MQQMQFEQLPYIFIDISQPRSKGRFLVRTSDHTTGERITENYLKEQVSYFEYFYTARIIENNRGGLGVKLIAISDQDRLADLTRYGQLLYGDLFGSDKRFKRHLTRKEHLKRGAKLVLRLHSTASELWTFPGNTYTMATSFWA